MGRAAFVVLLAWLSLTSGCAGATAGRQQRCQIQWERVCARLQPSPVDTPVATPPTSLTPAEIKTLARAAERAAGSVVRISTLVRDITPAIKY